MAAGAFATAPLHSVQSNVRRRRHVGDTSVVVVLATVALLVARSAFAAFGVSAPHAVSREGHLRGDAVARSAAVLEELISAASSGDVTAALDESFAKLTPEDFATLQARVANAKGDEVAPLRTLEMGIQAQMEKRMATAKGDIDALLMSSGDINENIRECLKKQDTPLPIMAVLQMNLEKAKAGGQEQQVAALGYVLKVMNAELEKQVPLENRVISKLLSCPDAPTRKAVVREALSALAPVTSAQLASALVQLVEDAEKRFGGSDASSSQAASAAGSQTLKGTLELIRKVAVDCGVIVGEVCGQDAQEEFVTELTPLFEALSK